MQEEKCRDEVAVVKEYFGISDEDLLQAELAKLSKEEIAELAALCAQKAKVEAAADGE